MIVEAAGRLRRAGLEAPQREARHLMTYASGLTTSGLILRGEQSPTATISDAFQKMIARREAREPFQHIVGTAPFYGLDFISDDRALVPRADSEILVEIALQLLPDRKPVSIADLGTGSGCLLIAVLDNCPHASGIGIEADADAAALARENILKHELAQRAGIEVLSWAEWKGWGDVDLIVSNPPYIRSEVVASLEPEVQLHDPVAALDGGKDGLDAYREIAGLARSYLKPGTPLILEIGFDQDRAVRDILSEAGLVRAGSDKDLNGNDRVVWGFQPES